MKKLYLFSGLGADKRAFSKLDLEGFELVHIDWLTALKNESLNNYVIRLAEFYNIPKDGGYVLGVSFGGICIAQLAKSYNFKKTVLISSAKVKSELPYLVRLNRFFTLQKLLPNFLLTTPTIVHNWLFGVKNKEESILLKKIIRDTNPEFMRWAINKITEWDNVSVPNQCLHIHGDSDNLIPIRNIDYDIKIRNGGHLMILSQADEISMHIRRILMS